MTEINTKLVEELDKSNVYGSVLTFTDQVTDAWDQSGKIQFVPKSPIKNIVVAAMGGSALGARFVASLYTDKLKVPLAVVNDYQLPGYVNEETLVIADSYSGSTEETLAAYGQAKERQAQIFVIVAGGQLAKLAESDKVPCFLIQPTFNPSQQPRMALGYPTGCLLELFAKLNLIDLKRDEIVSSCQRVRHSSETLKIENGGGVAADLARKLYDRLGILVASEHLLGAIHATHNQINENAKSLAMTFPLPELCHHLLEALQFPSTVKEARFFLFCESSLYQLRNQKRYEITKRLLGKKGIPYESYVAGGQTRLEQALEVVQLGAFVNFYLALLNGVDPAPIPSVEWFKDQMAR